MCMQHMQQCTSVCFKLIWSNRDLSFINGFLNDYFERTADWSNAVMDMGLVFNNSKPYPHLAGLGDYYVDSDLRMSQFALDCAGHVILVALDPDEQPVYFLLLD